MSAVRPDTDCHAELLARLGNALARFQCEANPQCAATDAVPDARQRLAHVVRLTDDAAHRTLDLVEQSGPLAARIGEGARSLAVSAADGAGCEGEIAAYLAATAVDAETLRRNLSEVLLAQCYQDLTGQIIRGVINLVSEIADVLAELAHETGHTGSAHAPALAHAVDGSALKGQQDVDALFSDLGL